LTNINTRYISIQEQSKNHKLL